MALFAKKKDEAEHEDTSEIKQQAGSPPPFSLNNSNLDMGANSMNPQNNNQPQMNNPFDNSPQQQQQMYNSQNNNHPQMNNPFDNSPQQQQQMYNSQNNNHPQMNNPFDNPPQQQQQMNIPQNSQQPEMNNSFDSPPQQQQQQQQINNNPSDFGGFAPQQASSLDQEQIQELIDETVEKIIDDRWESITSNIEKVVSWKEKVENDVHLLKEDLVAIKNGFENLEKKLTSKIGSYDKNILDVNSEIKALEKVFQKITPTLVNNVNELSKIAKELKSTDKNISNKK